MATRFIAPASGSVATPAQRAKQATDVAAPPVTFRKYLAWVAAQATVVLLFLPWFLLFASSYRTWSDSTAFDFALFVQFYTTMVAAGVASNIDQWLPVVVAIWAILLIGAALGLRGAHDGASRRGGWLIVFLLVLPPLTVYLGTSPRSFFYTPRVEARYLMPFIWSFALVLGWCVWRIARASRWLGVAVTVALLGLFAAPLAQYYAGRIPSDVYQSLAATLRAHRRAGDAIVLHDDRTWPIFEFYFRLPDRRWRGVPNGARVREGDAERLLGDLWARSDGLWMVWNEDALRIDEDHLLEKWLSERAAKAWEMPFGTKRLLFYARTPERAQLGLTLEAEASPAVRAQLAVGEGVSLTGYDLALKRYRPGDEIQFGAYWLTAGADEVDILLASDSGDVRASQHAALPSGAARTLTRFPVTTALQPGEYWLDVRRGGTRWHLTRVEIAPTSGARAVSGLPSFTPREVRFQNGIQLIGYDMPATVLKAGDNVQLTLYWQTDQPILQRYKAFVHLLGTQWNPRTNNPLWGQRDQEPANGALPTTAWGAGSLIEDAYLFRVAPDAPPGKYQIEVGIYHPTTGERLSVLSGGAGDHAILLEVEVR